MYGEWNRRIDQALSLECKRNFDNPGYGVGQHEEQSKRLVSYANGYIHGHIGHPDHLAVEWYLDANGLLLGLGVMVGLLAYLWLRGG